MLLNNLPLINHFADGCWLLSPCACLFVFFFFVFLRRLQKEIATQPSHLFPTTHLSGDLEHACHALVCLFLLSSFSQAQMMLLKKQQEINSLACRIYVGSINYEFDEEVIRVPFSVFGPITKIDMPRENGRSKGFCFVEYQTPEQANNALVAMNGFILGGRHVFLMMDSSLSL